MRKRTDGPFEMNPMIPTAGVRPDQRLPVLANGAACVMIYSWGVLDVDDLLQQRKEREVTHLRSDNERLRKRLILLSRLSQRVAFSLEIETVFQDVVDSACELTGARYGALGVFDAGGRIEKFITHGLSQEERGRIGMLPEGLGILGWLRDIEEPLRLGDLTKHPRSVGFPHDHPPMKTFLGAPIRHADEKLGNIYLTEKENSEDFTSEDESLLILFAAQAAMAIRNAQLHRQLQDLVLVEERDRIGMDLHDGVIQSLYATGLRLESCLEDLDDRNGGIAPQLTKAMEQLNQVIADIRSYIFRLQPGVLADADLAGAIGALLQEMKVNALLDVELRETSGACRGLTGEQMNALFLVAQEALANARKHAQASKVSAYLDRQEHRFLMKITDDGVGFDPAGANTGHGLRNMRERVEKLGGVFEVTSLAGAGANVIVTLAIDQAGSDD
jgi:signal transduction histidine kinase